MSRLRVISLFSGIGAFEKALTNIGIDYELVNFCEFDKYAIQSYCAIHGVDKSINLGDITKVDLDMLPENIDLITHGSPCQDFSIAGKQLGDKGNRSVLMWNSVEIIRRIKPKYVIWENVKNVLSAKHRHNFDQYLEALNDIGYTSYYEVLNSKDYGVPQNRERIFCVSILGEHTEYEFPLPTGETVRLKDILEDEVDEKYYINKPFTFIEKQDNDSVCSRIGNVDLNGHDYIKRVYDVEKCSPTLPTGTGGNHEPKILENKIIHIANTNDSYESNARVYSEQGLSPTIAGRDYKDAKKILVEMKENYIQYDLTGKGHNSQDQRAYYENGFHGTLPSTGAESKCKVLYENYRIRKLTPTECWRLQAFSDEDIKKCINVGISNSQLYKQAGNSITVKVLEYIFKELFKEYISDSSFTQPQEN